MQINAAVVKCTLTLLAFTLPSIRGAEVTVGTATAHAGERATGFLQVASGVDAPANIPVIVIQGAKAGPRLALVAGSHGTEYASIIALEKLARSIDPAVLSGTVVIVPLINLGSFAQKVPHVNPADGKNMNRMYPGDPNGTQTDRVSWEIGRQVVQPSDYLIDLHGGDLDENLRRYTYWMQTGIAELDATSRGMVMAFGLDHIVIQKKEGKAVPGSDTNFSIFRGSGETNRHCGSRPCRHHQC